MDQPQIQELLTEILGSDNVYFQPPPTVKMAYPGILYQQDAADTIFADNSPYRHTKRYSVTLITQDPIHEAYEKLAALPMSTFERFFPAGNLNHYVFNVYF